MLNRSHTKKAYFFTKNIEFSGKSSEERASRQKKDKRERVTGLGRRTREEIAKWNQMTAQIPGRGKTSDIPGLPSGARKQAKLKGEIIVKETK